MSSLGFLAWTVFLAWLVILVGTMGAAIYWARTDPSGQHVESGPSLIWNPFLGAVYPFVIVYHYLRGGPDLPPGSIAWPKRAAASFAIAGAVSLVLGGIAAPPDPFSLLFSMTILYPIGLTAGYLLTSSRFAHRSSV